LPFEACDSHHEELVQVGADDGEEFDSLQQGNSVVLRLLEYALLEIQKAELTIHVEFGIVERRNDGRAAGCIPADGTSPVAAAGLLRSILRCDCFWITRGNGLRHCFGEHKLQRNCNLQSMVSSAISRAWSQF
jgi:hypothetical protein